MIQALQNSQTNLEDGIYLIGISTYSYDGLYLEQHIGEAMIKDYDEYTTISEYVYQILVNSNVRWKLDFITKIAYINELR